MLALPTAWSLVDRPGPGRGHAADGARVRRGRSPSPTNLKLFPALAAIWWVGRRDWPLARPVRVWLAVFGVVQLVLEPAGTLAFPAFLGLDQVGDVDEPLARSVLAVAVGASRSSSGSSSPGGSRRRAGAGRRRSPSRVLATPRLLVYQLLTLVAGAARADSDDDGREPDR